MVGGVGLGDFMAEGDGLGQKLSLEISGDQTGGGGSEQERWSPQPTILLAQRHTERLQARVH